MSEGQRRARTSSTIENIPSLTTTAESASGAHATPIRPTAYYHINQDSPSNIPEYSQSALLLDKEVSPVFGQTVSERVSSQQITGQSPPIPQGGRRRRASTLTSTACNHCKRAHLGCDSLRPCTRCIISGKEVSLTDRDFVHIRTMLTIAQATCADVPQKKRGRPRIRGGSLELSTAGSAAAVHGEPVQDLAQVEGPLEGSHQTSRGSIQSGPPRRTPPTTTSETSPGLVRGSVMSTSRNPFPVMRRISEPLIPKVMLDTDLNILHSNPVFNRLIGRSEPGPGTKLSEIATTTLDGGLMVIQSNLRDERESKDPAFLPPIAASTPSHFEPPEEVNSTLR